MWTYLNLWRLVAPLSLCEMECSWLEGLKLSRLRFNGLTIFYSSCYFLFEIWLQTIYFYFIIYYIFLFLKFFSRLLPICYIRFIFFSCSIGSDKTNPNQHLIRLLWGVGLYICEWCKNHWIELDAYLYFSVFW